MIMCINCLTHDERGLALAYVDQSIAVLEKRETIPYEPDMLELVYTAWIAAVRRGLKSAQEFIGQVTGVLTQDDLRVMLAVLGDEAGPKMAEPIREGLQKLFNRSYLNGKAMTAAEELARISFTLTDETTIGWLTRHHVYWIGNYYDRNISGAIAETVAGGLEQGLGRDEVGKLLKGFFKEYPGVKVKPDNYWSGLAGTAMNRSRTFGEVRGYREVGIDRYEILTANDERVCPICSEMDRRVFEVKRADSLITQITQTDNPEDVKAILPWLPAGEITGLSNDQLMNRGFMMPSFHFACRCTVVAA